MKKYIPVLVKLYFRLASDPEFKQLVYNIAVVEGRWLAKELPAQEAWNQVIGYVRGYLEGRAEFHAL